MSILKGLTNLAQQAGIIEVEEGENPSVGNANDANATSVAENHSAPIQQTNYLVENNVNSQPQVIGVSVADPKIVETLLGVVKSPEVCSPGYLLFMETLDKMSAIMGMTPAAQFQAAMVAANISFEEIMQTYEKKLSKLSNEEENSIAGLKSKHDNFANESNEEINRFNAQIEENNKKIAELNAANQTAYNAVNNLKTRISDSQVRTANKQGAFRASVAEVRAKVEQDRNRATQNNPVQNNPAGGAK